MPLTIDVCCVTALVCALTLCAALIDPPFVESTLVMLLADTLRLKFPASVPMTVPWPLLGDWLASGEIL